MIEIKDGSISLSRDGRRNLRLALCLTTGDFAVLLGRNGSGKTTMLDVVAGVQPLDTGALLVEPSDGLVAYVVQDSASGLLPWRTILSNILLPSRLHSNSSEPMADKAVKLLTAFGLLERKDDFPYRLSEGEKQVVNLIRAVCTPASILLLDEPFAALNAKGRTLAKEIIAEFAAGRTTVLVTHDPLDLDLPVSRCFVITDSTLAEINMNEAKEFLENVTPKASG